MSGNTNAQVARLDRPAVSGPTRGHGLTRLIRDNIISGVHAPESKLPFQALGERYQAGVSTLREALTTLVAEGLVEARSRRGFWVRPMSVDDLKDLTRMRVLIENEALRLSIAKGDELWRQRVRRALVAFEELQGEPAYPQTQALHYALHDTLISACGSDRLRELTRTLLYQQARYRHLHRELLKAPSRMVSVHAELIDAAVRGKADLACAFNADHIETASEQILEKLAQLTPQLRGALAP